MLVVAGEVARSMEVQWLAVKVVEVVEVVQEMAFVERWEELARWAW